jgi:hypothetical protein
VSQRDRIAAALLEDQVPWATPYADWRKSENVEDWRVPTTSPFDHAFRALPYTTSVPILRPLPPSTPLSRDLGEDDLKRLQGEPDFRRRR